MARKNPIGVAIVGAIVFFVIYSLVKYLIYNIFSWTESLIVAGVVFVAYLIAQIIVNNKSHGQIISVKKKRR